MPSSTTRPFRFCVRAVVGNISGRWSAWSTLTVGGLPQVQNVSALSSAQGDITVSWDRLGQSGVNYVARLTGGGIDYSAPAVTDANTVTIAHGVPPVTCDTVYAVTVTPNTGTIFGPPSQPVTVTACQVSRYPIDPGHPVADPINAATGAYIYANTDLAVPAIMPLILTSYYNGSWPTPAENPLVTSTPLGNRWTHSYLTWLAPDSADAYVYIFWGVQQIERFAVPGSGTGTYTPAGAAPGSSLLRAVDLSYTLTRADATSYLFNSDGTLGAIVDRFGNTNACLPGWPVGDRDRHRHRPQPDLRLCGRPVAYRHRPGRTRRQLCWPPAI